MFLKHFLFFFTNLNISVFFYIVKQHVVGEFPNLEENVIDMALNICQHNEEKCCTLLNSWNERKESET